MVFHLAHGGNVATISDEVRAAHLKRAKKDARALRRAFRTFEENTAITMRGARDQSPYSAPYIVQRYLSSTRPEYWNKDDLALELYNQLNFFRREKKSLGWGPDFFGERRRARQVAEHASVLFEIMAPVNEMFFGIIAEGSSQRKVKDAKAAQKNLAEALASEYDAAYLAQQIIFDPAQSFEERVRAEAKKRRFLHEPWTELQSLRGQGWDTEEAMVQSSLARHVLFHSHVVFMPDIFPRNADGALRYRQLYTVEKARSKQPQYTPRFGMAVHRTPGSGGVEYLDLISAYLVKPAILTALLEDKTGLGKIILNAMGEVAMEKNHDDMHDAIYGIDTAGSKQRMNEFSFFNETAPVARQAHPAIDEWAERLQSTDGQVTGIEHYSFLAHRERVEHASARRPEFARSRIARACAFMQHLEQFRKQGGIDYADSEYLAAFYLRRVFVDINPADPSLASLCEAVDTLLPQPRKVRVKDIYRYLTNHKAFDHHTAAFAFILNLLDTDENYLAKMNSDAMEVHPGATILGRFIRFHGMFSILPNYQPLTHPEAREAMQALAFMYDIEQTLGNSYRLIPKIAFLFRSGVRGRLTTAEETIVERCAENAGIDVAQRYWMAHRLETLQREGRGARTYLGSLKFWNELVIQEFLNQIPPEYAAHLLAHGLSGPPSQAYPAHLRATYGFFQDALLTPEGVRAALSGFDAQRLRVSIGIHLYDIILHFDPVPYREHMTAAEMNNPTHRKHRQPVPQLQAWQITEHYADAFSDIVAANGISRADYVAQRRETGMRIKSREHQINSAIHACELPYFHDPETRSGLVSQIRMMVTDEKDIAACERMTDAVETCARILRSRHPNRANFRSIDSMPDAVEAFSDVVMRHCSPAQGYEARQHMERLLQNFMVLAGRAEAIQR